MLLNSVIDAVTESFPALFCNCSIFFLPEIVVIFSLSEFCECQLDEHYLQKLSSSGMLKYRAFYRQCENIGVFSEELSVAVW